MDGYYSRNVVPLLSPPGLIGYTALSMQSVSLSSLFCDYIKQFHLLLSAIFAQHFYRKFGWCRQTEKYAWRQSQRTDHRPQTRHKVPFYCVCS